MVTIERAWREKNEMAAIGEFIQLFRQLKLSPSQIWGDDDGAGKPMIARFHKLGWPINRFHAGARALKDTDYFNRGAEVWGDGGKALKDGTIILPQDKVMAGQMICRQRITRSDGRFQASTRRRCGTVA